MGAPVQSVFQNGTPVDKSLLIGIDTAGLRWRVANAAAIRSTDFSSYNCLYVGSTQINYDLDPADTTTPDDGTDSSNCIIDSMGNRFKNSQIGLLADLATLLSNTTAALAVTSVTVATETSLPNSRKIAVTAPLAMVDGGAGGLLTLSLGSVLAVANGGTGQTVFSVPSNKRNAFSASHTIANADKNSCVTFTNPGGGYVCTFLNPSNYDADFSCIVNNESQRAVKLVLTNYADGTTLTTRIYPLQSYYIFAQNGLWFILGGVKRWMQSTAPTFYVDPSGSDSNDGLATGAGNAMQTILACWNRILDETETPQATIQLTPGATYPATGELDGDRGGAFGRLINILGDPTTASPSRIICGGSDTCVTLRDGAWATFDGIAFGASGSGSNGAHLEQSSLADFSNCLWGTMTGGNHLILSDNAQANITGNQVIAGNANVHWNIQEQSKLLVGGVTIDAGSNGWNFPDAFLIASILSRITFQTPTFANCGFITGPRTIIQHHSIFSGGGVTVPGSSAGSTDSTSESI